MVFPPNIVEMLLKHDKDVVSGLYFLRKMLLPSFRFLKEDGNYQSSYEFEKNSLIKVDACGLGCMLIKRKVLEKVSSQNQGKPLFFTKYEKNSRTKVFGEDTVFCELIKKAGFEIFVATGVVLGHYGGIIPDSVFRGYIY
jgi:GT2 family glycosyltransferase